MRFDASRLMTKNRTTISLWLLVLAVLTWMPTPAQAQQQVRQITFDEAIQIALDQSIALKRAANNLELQSVGVSQARANFLPNLNFGGNTSRNFGLSFDQTTGRATTVNSDGFNMGFSAGVNLFNGFGDVANLSEARLNLEATDFAFQRQRQGVVFSVMSTYLNLIGQREQIRIREENLSSQEQQLAQIEEFVRVGSRPMSDLFQQQATTALAESQLLESQRLYRITVATMIQVLQLDPFGNYEFITPEVNEATGLVPESYDLDGLLRSAFDQRDDLRAQEASVGANVQGIRSAKSGYYPTLSLSGGVNTRFSSLQQQLVRDGAGNPILDPEGNPSFEDVSFSDQLENNRSQSIGMSFSVPIFNRLLVKSNVDRSRVQYENAKLDLENLRQDIAIQVRTAYLDYLTDEKQLDVTDKQLQAAQQALDAEQERYNVGASTLVELTQANASYVQAQSNRVEAVYSFIFRKKLIEYYVGIIDPAQPLFE